MTLKFTVRWLPRGTVMGVWYVGYVYGATDRVSLGTRWMSPWKAFWPVFLTVTAYGVQVPWVPFSCQRCVTVTVIVGSEAAATGVAGRASSRPTTATAAAPSRDPHRTAW